MTIPAGKPLVSIPAFLVITFESTVLWGCLFTLFGLLLMCRLPASNLQVEVSDPRLSDDKFGFVLNSLKSKDAEKVMEIIVELIETLKNFKSMLDSMMDIFGPDMDLSLPGGGDIAMEAATNWRGALENAYNMKNMTNAFSDVDILAKTAIEGVGTATNNEVDPSDLQAVMFTYNDRGTQLIQETSDFAKVMMTLADLAGDLQVAEQDLAIAQEQVY